METKMQLAQDELDILEGKAGELKQKMMKALVMLGDAYGAKRLVPITAGSHIEIPFAPSEIEVFVELIDAMIAENLKAEKPFTINPMPYDPDHMKGGKGPYKKLYDKPEDFYEKLNKLGLKDSWAKTCTCYLDVVKHSPKQGDILAWSENTAVIYANSIFGAKSNNNAGIIALFGTLLGKVPEYGLLLDENRKATWNIVVNTRNLPNPQLAGEAIGRKIGKEVAYIQGLDQFLGRRIEEAGVDFLKDLTGVIAEIGGSSLCHVHLMTPEAVEHGKSLIQENAQVHMVDDDELNEIKYGYPMPWKKNEVKVDLCLIGCPQLSNTQIELWLDIITRGIKMHEKEKVTVPTYFCCGPDVFQKFEAEYNLYNKMVETGVEFTRMCPYMFLRNPKWKNKKVITNSSKLRHLSNVRFYENNELASIIASGRSE